MRLDFTDVFGNACSLRYDHVDHAFIAYCGKHKDARCTATRTLNAGKRPGSGRPLGFLVAWLLCGGDHSTKEQHIEMPVPSKMLRRAARNYLKAQPASPALFALEAPQEDEDNEPEVFAR